QDRSDGFLSGGSDPWTSSWQAPDSSSSSFGPGWELGTAFNDAGFTASVSTSGNSPSSAADGATLAQTVGPGPIVPVSLSQNLFAAPQIDGPMLAGGLTAPVTDTATGTTGSAALLADQLRST